MLWWWFFICVHNYVSIFWFIAINAKNSKMSLNGQPNRFSSKTISCTCDLHLKLNILNPLNICFCQMFKKMNPLPYNLLLQNFKTWNFYMIWVFVKFTQWTCTFIKGDMFLLYKFFEINYVTLCIPLITFLKSAI
jgi:hypothetical protein